MTWLIHDGSPGKTAALECYTQAELDEIAAVMQNMDRLRQFMLDHPIPAEYFEGEMPMPF